MRPARAEAALYEGEASLRGEGAVVGEGLLRARLGLPADVDPVFGRVLEDIAAQLALRRLRTAPDDAEVVFFYLALLYLLVYDAQSLGVFGGDDYAAGVAVYAVAERGGEGVLLARAPLALLIGVGLDIGDEGVVIPLSRAVAEDARFLVREQDVLVLVDDVEPRAPTLR